MTPALASIALSDPRAVAVVGLPAVGKSTIGRRLARLLGRGFIDLDDLIEEEAGATIATLFEQQGEEHFRELELSVLKRSSSPDLVIATGGGIVLDQRCRLVLAARTHCVYLRAPVEALVPRLRRTGMRPLFHAVDARAKLLELEHRREPLYREVAHLTVDTQGRSASRVAHEIASQLAKIEKGWIQPC